MTDVDAQGRAEPPLAAGEPATLLGFLDFQRATLEWKCEGLDATALRATTAASAMTLGGLLKHLAYVEDHWCSWALHGHVRQPPWDAVDWAADPDWDWRSAAGDSPAELLALWRNSVSRSRSLVAEALSEDDGEGGGLERLGRRVLPNGTAPSLRWILCHLTQEYARHNGHADLLRESLDGATGE
ncbi:DinB family protein [Streptomyces armeniacus]|uniref:DinB family protein n=1 Tax=Streptomyces armeniacus TaxID=83291 RepID=A0A345XVL6_9ACTN|nr:DinB family protein [Streptomyces armeniacus]AXK35682.1 DinB family protein [Streptomyces armeniacus]